MVDDRVGGEPEVRAPQVLGHAGVAHRHAPHVGLVDDGAVPRGAGAPVVAPREGRVDRPGTWASRRPSHGGRWSGPRRRRRRCSRTVRRTTWIGPRDRLGVGVDEQLVPVEAVSVLGLVGAVDPVAVEGARAHVGEVGVPDPVGRLGQLDASRYGTPASASSNRHSSTAVACSEKSAKLTPPPSQVAPSGWGLPGQTLTGAPAARARSEP